MLELLADECPDRAEVLQCVEQCTPTPASTPRRTSQQQPTLTVSAYEGYFKDSLYAFIAPWVTTVVVGRSVKRVPETHHPSDNPDLLLVDIWHRLAVISQ